MTKAKASTVAGRAKASASPQPPARTAAKPKGNTVKGSSEPVKAHKLCAMSEAQNACALEPWSVFGSADPSELALTLREAAGALSERGDMRGAEAMLHGQAMALQAIFTNLSRRAALNAGEYINAAERYLRLALKAQAQCRATLETLAAIKNPPVVFARQANINNGGQQQVNNGAPPAHAMQSTEPAPSTHAGESASAPNELLEDCTHGRTQLDTRATAAASRANPGLEPVGAFDRAANR